MSRRIRIDSSYLDHYAATLHVGGTPLADYVHAKGPEGGEFLCAKGNTPDDATRKLMAEVGRAYLATVEDE